MFKVEVRPTEISLLFPKRYNRKPIKVKNNNNGKLASTILCIKLIKFTVDELTKYVNQRERAYMATDNYTSERKHAIDNIRFRLELAKESRIKGAARQLSICRFSFDKIRPYSHSSHYENYQNRVEPLLEFFNSIMNRG